jgi:hypothetical protein
MQKLSVKKRKKLGQLGLLVRRPYRNREKDIREKHTNHLGEFEMKNLRFKDKKSERIKLDDVHELNKDRGLYLLKGISNRDNKPITRIISHTN